MTHVSNQAQCTPRLSLGACKARAEGIYAKEKRTLGHSQLILNIGFFNKRRHIVVLK